VQLPSKKAARLYCKYMLDVMPHWTEIPLDSEEGAILQFLVQRHPYADSLIGCGIRHFTARGRRHQRKHFELCRTDCSSVAFSWRECLDSKPVDADISSGTSSKQQQQGRMLLKDDYSKALQNAVAEQTIWFKIRNSYSVCPLSGDYLRLDNSDVDHVAPHTFAALVEGWLQQDGICLADVQVKSGTITNRQQMGSWCSYHSEHAVLRLVSRRAHRELSRKPLSSRSTSHSTSSSTSDDDMQQVRTSTASSGSGSDCSDAGSSESSESSCEEL
jgi:hypothetical protein